MSYVKRGFENGKVLTAEDLNHIEDGILSVEGIVVTFTPQSLTEEQKAQARYNLGIDATLHQATVE